MLNYGFGKCSRFVDENVLEEPIFAEVTRGIEKQVEGEAENSFQYVDVTGADLNAITKETTVEQLDAPVKQGDTIGRVSYKLNGEKIGEVAIYAKEDVGAMTFFSALLDVLEEMTV